MSTILVVDDDIALLASLGVQLEQVGYTVLKTSEAESAEIIFQERRPNLVVLEVRTSRDKGWDLLERFAGQVPVMVLSAYGREEDVVRGLKAGAVDYVAKPYRSDELFSRIESRIGKPPPPTPKEIPPPPKNVALIPPKDTAPAPSKSSMSDSIPLSPKDVIPIPSPPPPRSKSTTLAIDETTPSHEQNNVSQPIPHSPIVEPATPPIHPSPPTMPAATLSAASPSAPPASPPTPSTPTRPRQSVPSTPVHDDSTFMDEMEELALLRADSQEHGPATPDADEPATEPRRLGERLRAERKRRRITLVQAENELHIRMWYLQAMEEENFSLLPRGPMAAQMLSNYAKYLKLDVAPIMEEYQRNYATSGEYPRHAMGLGFDKERPPIPQWVVWVAAVILALIVSGVAIYFLDPEGMTTLGNSLRALFGSGLSLPHMMAEWLVLPT